MAYHVIRYIANKPCDYNGTDKLEAEPTIQYTRNEKEKAEQILTRLYEISANQKNMVIIKRTRYTFRCENTSHRYLFKIVKGDNKTREKLLEKIDL